MLLFAMVIGIVKLNMPFHDVYKQGIQVLIEADVEVAACVSFAGGIGFEKEQKNQNQTRPRLRLRRRARQPVLHDYEILRV